MLLLVAAVAAVNVNAVNVNNAAVVNTTAVVNVNAACLPPYLPACLRARPPD